MADKSNQGQVEKNRGTVTEFTSSNGSRTTGKVGSAKSKANNIKGDTRKAGNPRKG